MFCFGKVEQCLVYIHGITKNDNEPMWSAMSRTPKMTSQRGQTRNRTDKMMRWTHEAMRRLLKTMSRTQKNNDSTRSIGVRKRWNAITKRGVEHFVQDLPSYWAPSPTFTYLQPYQPGKTRMYLFKVSEEPDNSWNPATLPDLAALWSWIQKLCD